MKTLCCCSCCLVALDIALVVVVAVVEDTDNTGRRYSSGSSKDKRHSRSPAQDSVQEDSHGSSDKENSSNMAPTTRKCQENKKAATKRKSKEFVALEELLAKKRAKDDDEEEAPGEDLSEQEDDDKITVGKEDLMEAMDKLKEKKEKLHLQIADLEYGRTSLPAIRRKLSRTMKNLSLDEKIWVNRIHKAVKRHLWGKRIFVNTPTMLERGLEILLEKMELHEYDMITNDKEKVTFAAQFKEDNSTLVRESYNDSVSILEL